MSSGTIEALFDELFLFIPVFEGELLEPRHIKFDKGKSKTIFLLNLLIFALYNLRVYEGIKVLDSVEGLICIIVGLSPRDKTSIAIKSVYDPSEILDGHHCK